MSVDKDMKRKIWLWRGCINKAKQNQTMTDLTGRQMKPDLEERSNLGPINKQLIKTFQDQFPQRWT